MIDNSARGPGAAPSDWARLQEYGLTEDLLPVVSDTSVAVDPESTMKGVGKTPSRINHRGNAVGIGKWTQQLTSHRQVQDWAKDSRLGICVQTRCVRAIDVDIDDATVSAQVRELAEAMLGALPCRWRSNSGKLLLAFAMPGEFTKRVIHTDHGAVEFLANGQQFIAFGTHTSGVRYEWQGLEACDVLGEFPAVDAAAFEAFWSGLESVFGSSVTQRSGALPTVQRSRADIKDPVVQYLADHGWLRSLGADGVAHVICPWKDEHTSDSGVTETSWFPAGVGDIAHGNFKCLHSHCTGRSNDAFLAAVGYTDTEFEVVPVAPSEPEPLPVFTRAKDGSIEATANNAALALSRPDFTGWRLAVDEFMGRRVIGPAEGGEWRAFKDSDYFMLRQVLELRGFKKPSHELVREAVRFVSERASFDSAIDWARSLKWDGVKRVQTFFTRYAGAEDTPYTRAVSRYLWTALAGRCLTPGEKTDMVPVLIGAQGSGKTSLVEALAPTPEAFVEINLGNRNEEQTSRQLRGKLVGEIAELRGLAGRDSEDIKAWITRRHEEIRALYTEFHGVYHRRLVMIGTSNKDEFLDDDTGERRWLPLRVGNSDLAALHADRDQLWAEGAVLYAASGVEWKHAQQLAAEVHSEFKVHDTWADAIEAWVANGDMDGLGVGPRRFSSHEVLTGALRFADPQINKAAEMRVARVLRTIGFSPVYVWEGGKNRKKWERAENSMV